jgi:hypothetical protein
MSATIIVQFGKGADSSALVKVELDGAVNLDSSGKEKTQFYAGDQPVFLVHHDATVHLDHIECSSGMIQELGTVIRQRKQQMSFPAADSQELDYVPAGVVAVTWFGNDGVLQQTGRTMLPTGNLPAVCDLVVPVEFRQFRLLPPSLTLEKEGDEWPVLVVLHMEAA